MYIMTQDNRRLINGDFVSQIFISETPDEIKLMAAVDDEDMDIALGSFETVEHAETVLKFIGVCLVDPDAQAKITQVPTRKDLSLKDELFAGGFNPEGMKKLFEQVMSGRRSAKKTARTTNLTFFRCLANC